MEELLTCSVCCERYCEVDRQPVLLPRCGHSFCRPCVTLLLSGGCIICPTCRTDQRVDSAHRLPTEFTLLAIIAAQENTKLDNCKRHDVKLSFWCQTCGEATCGECLFEDHPTHSHNVIKAATYIQHIKDSVQDVACKFMDALDNREQTYYRAVYMSARTIDESLRNVTVLRKDMSEARQLMKGIKEEEIGISSATSLAEAAKFLGLKWNIQDANFNRTQQVRNEKEVKETPEEEKEQTKPVKGTKKKKRQSIAEILERREEEKKEGKLGEKKEEKQEEKKEEDEASKSMSPEPVSPVAETPKDAKRRLSIKKSKTLAVFEPLSMDKEINGIKEKIIELDNKERERIEEEKLKLIEEEEQEEKDKNLLERKQEEAKLAADAAVAAVNAAAKEKERKIKEREDSEAKKRAEELEAKNKAAEEELERLNQILKKPRGKLARKYLADKIEPESAKLESEKKSPAKISKSLKNTEESSDHSAEKDKDGEEKVNGVPEREDKDEDAEEPKKEAAEVDPFQGELTPEEKEAKQAEENTKKEEDASSIFDFMKAPLFTVCVEGSEGRLALLQWEQRGLHVYCHQFQQLDYDIAIKMPVLQALIPTKNPLVFLELTVGSSRPHRVYIQLWGHLRRARNFMALCIGDQGSAFLNTKLLQTYNYNEPGERILGGDHEHNSGRGGCALLDDLEWNGDYCMPMKEGLVTAAGSGQQATNSLFLMCTQNDEARNFSCPFGEIVTGLDAVRECISRSHHREEEIWITDCGVVLEPPRIC
ncbi:B-box-type zinc finger [Trinorchestia longiramus]|nr:B-box-type zinc finger [Trinorchestia longiramus]